MILWGPPGTGNSTLAEIIGHYADAAIEKISAVTSGIKEIREAIEIARQNRQLGRRTILWVDMKCIASIKVNKMPFYLI